MQGKKEIFNIFVSVILIVSILIGISPVSAAVSSDKAETAEEDSYVSEEFKVPDIIDEKERAEKSYVERVKEDEKDLYTFVFKDENGNNTMRVFSHPVKYVDEKGDIRDISLEISKNKDGLFKSADHMINVSFGENISEGIKFEYRDAKIKMNAEFEDRVKANAVLSREGKKLTYAIDDKTSYVYSLTYRGIKEDIVVKEYTGQTEYEFTLNTYGLHPVRVDNSVFLADRNEEIKVSMGDVIVFTADGRNNSFGDLRFETVERDSMYKFTVVLDDNYLTDKKTVYPITIDPTIEYIDYDDGIIQDITIGENLTFKGAWKFLHVGKDQNGNKMRSLIKFHNFTVPVGFGPFILSASVEIQDVFCEGYHNMEIYCYAYNENSPTWYESQTNTWEGLGSNITSTLADHHSVVNGNGNVPGQNQRYSFDITSIVKEWAVGERSPEKGIVFTAGPSFESNGTNDWYRSFGSVNRSSSQPSLSITYETMGIFTLLTYVNLTFEELYAVEDEKTVRKTTYYSNHQYDGKYLWCIRAVPDTQYVTITSLGMKYNGGEKGYSLQTNYLQTSLVMENDNDPSCQFKAELSGGYYYTFKDIQTNLYMSYSVSSDKLLFSYTKEFSCCMVPTRIKTDTFNNFWSGGYSQGMNDGVLHIKVNVENAVKNHYIYKNFNFNSVLWWNGITDKVVIYGPNENHPDSITPLNVTIKLGYEGIIWTNGEPPFALTVPNVDETTYVSMTDDNRDALGASDWNCVNIYLSALGKDGGMDVSHNPFSTISAQYLQSEFSSILCHEFGHVLKLAHLVDINNDGQRHTFAGCRGNYDEIVSTETDPMTGELQHTGCVNVYSVMNWGLCTDEDNKTTAMRPQCHDKINLISKFEYHLDCSH